MSPLINAFSHLQQLLFNKKNETMASFSNATDGIRTCDTWRRKPVLYPTELQLHPPDTRHKSNYIILSNKSKQKK